MCLFKKKKPVVEERIVEKVVEKIVTVAEASKYSIMFGCYNMPNCISNNVLIMNTEIITHGCNVIYCNDYSVGILDNTLTFTMGDLFGPFVASTKIAQEEGNDPIGYEFLLPICDKYLREFTESKAEKVYEDEFNAASRFIGVTCKDYPIMASVGNKNGFLFDGYTIDRRFDQAFSKTLDNRLGEDFAYSKIKIEDIGNNSIIITSSNISEDTAIMDMFKNYGKDLIKCNRNIYKTIKRNCTENKNFSYIIIHKN